MQFIFEGVRNLVWQILYLGSTFQFPKISFSSLGALEGYHIRTSQCIILVILVLWNTMVMLHKVPAEMQHDAIIFISKVHNLQLSIIGRVMQRILFAGLTLICILYMHLFLLPMPYFLLTLFPSTPRESERKPGPKRKTQQQGSTPMR